MRREEEDELCKKLKSLSHLLTTIGDRVDRHEEAR